jgi:hypothetical protein
MQQAQMNYNMNDWIVANINNPDFETYDFVNIANMNAENT